MSTGNQIDDEIALLEQRQEWSALWRLFCDSTPRTTTKICLILGEKNWEPDNDEQRDLFRQILALAKKSLSEVTEEKDLPGITGGFSGGGHYGISEDGKYLAITSTMPGIDLYDLKAAKKTKSIKQSDVCKIALNSQSDLIVATGGVNDSVAAAWSISDGAKLRDFQPTPKCWKDIAISPNGRLVAIGCQRGSVRWWDLNDETVFVRFTAGIGRADCLAFSPDGKLIAAGQSSVRVWTTDDIKQFRDFNCKSSIDQLHFSSDSKILIGSGMSGVTIWNISKGTIHQHINTDAYGCALHPNDRLLVTAGWMSNTAYFWDIETATQVGELKLSSFQGRATFLPDASHLIVAQSKGLRFLPAGRWNNEVLEKQLTELFDINIREITPQQAQDLRRLVASDWLNREFSAKLQITDALCQWKHKEFFSTLQKHTELEISQANVETTPAAQHENVIEIEYYDRLCKTPVTSVKEADRRHAAESLFLVGSPKAFQLLADAATSLTSRSKLVHGIAYDQLRKGSSRECIDAVCETWFVTRSNELEQLIREKRWIAETPISSHVATCLLTEQLQLIKAGQEEIALIARLLHDSNETISKNASHALNTMVTDDAREQICQLVINTNSEKLIHSALQSKYLPARQTDKVLFLILTGQFERLSQFQNDDILQACRSSSPDIQARLLRMLDASKDPRLQEVLTACGSRTTLTQQLLDEEIRRLSAQVPGVEGKALRWQLAKLLGSGFSSISEEPKKSENSGALNLASSGRMQVSSIANDTCASAVGRDDGLGVHCKHIAITRLSDGVKKFRIPFSGKVYSLAISPDGMWLAAGSSHDGAVIHLWRLTDGELVTTLEPYGAWVNSLAFDPTGRFLANGNIGTTVHVWDVSDFSLWRRFRVDTNVQALAFSRTGDSLLVIGLDHTALYFLPSGVCTEVYSTDSTDSNDRTSNLHELADSDDVVGILPSRVEVELQTTLRRHPSLKKKVRGTVVNWNGLGRWNLTVDFPEAGLQDVSWEQIKIVDPRVLHNSLCAGLFSSEPGSVKRLDDSERTLGRLIDSLQFLSLSWDRQEELLPGLSTYPEALEHLISDLDLDHLLQSNKIGPNSHARLNKLYHLLHRIKNPERQAAYEEALKAAGLDLNALALSCIRVSSGDSDPDQESETDTDTELVSASALDVESLLEHVNREKIAEIENEFSDLEGFSDWTLDDLRSSAEMDDIRTIAKECLDILGIESRIPKLVWMTVDESGFSQSGDFRTAYPELMLRLIKIR